jgi:putative selenate reductase
LNCRKPIRSRTSPITAITADTFCPEYDGPYLKKPNFYGSRRAFDAGAPHDGFFVESNPPGFSMTGRIDGKLYRLDQHTDGFKYDDGTVVIHVDTHGALRLDAATPPPPRPYQLSMGRFHSLVTLLRGITSGVRIHAVNTPLLDDAAR